MVSTLISQNNKMNPCVSVIVPVYNVEQYLAQCIESIINQTLTNIEIILVDDGSTDSSGDICDNYSMLDDRIIVIHKSNEGLASARNIGIQESNSPYLMFVDSDDWVESDFCKVPYEIAHNHSIDIVLLNYKEIDNHHTSTWKHSYMIEGELSEAEALRFNCYYVNTAWIGLYNRELFSSASFPEIRYYEDIGVTHRLIHDANKIWLINKPLYNYRSNRPYSITNSSETKVHPDRKEMLFRRVWDLYDWGFMTCAQKYAFILLVEYGCYQFDSYKKLIDIACVKNSICTWKQRAMLKVLRLSPKLFDELRILLKRRIQY